MYAHSSLIIPFFMDLASNENFGLVLKNGLAALAFLAICRGFIVASIYENDDFIWEPARPHLRTLVFFLYVCAWLTFSYSCPYYYPFWFFLGILYLTFVEAGLEHPAPMQKPTRLRAFFKLYGTLLPFDQWGPKVQRLHRRLCNFLKYQTNGFCLFYQELWFNRRYRRVRRKIKHFFERPLRIRRYWYLCIKTSLRLSLAWVGIPFRQLPQFRISNTVGGALTRIILKSISALLTFFGATFLKTQLCAWVALGLAKTKVLWMRRPSLIEIFVNCFQPEAPVYIRKGHRINPPLRRPRLVNLFSDMEVFASKGSSLLVFMFLIWSFFARILLVMCLLGCF